MGTVALPGLKAFKLNFDLREEGERIQSSDSLGISFGHEND
jgi:hypothetical protein